MADAPLRKQRAVPAAQRSLYTLTVRAGAKVRKQQHPDLDHALAALEQEGRELEGSADGRAQGGTLIRRLEPVQIVIGRLELAGPDKLRAGASDAELERIVRDAVWRKELKHRVGEPGFRQPPRTMSAIGG